MSLTIGSGPLGGRPGDSNYAFESPAHKILFEADGRRLRAFVGDAVVLDSTRAHLLHETGIRPVAYVPLEDFDTTLLERTRTSTHCPFKGDASYWSLRVGDELREDAVWAYEEPLDEASWLGGFAALSPARADRWMVEDEHVAGHLRDPYHRIDVHASTRPVRVSVGDDLVAETKRPVLVFETSMPVRAYVPRGDLVAGHLAPSTTRTTSPYMGDATHWHVHAGGRRFPDAAWSYELPIAEAMKVAGYVCFEADGITVELG
ncbi:MAG TPA: DUF427 domain-containing protein [Solirubrobacteraceae bacterium]|jgi:uncharacterized protein (DUF427 family)|nr:DUF427 domain-containing protein [Solirubrobacteraceae bacterium]